MVLRLFARIVGIVGMTFSVIAAVIFGLLFLLSVLFSDEAIGILFAIANEQTRRFSESSQDIILITVRIVLLFAFLLSLIQVFAAWNLIQGTEEDVESSRGVWCCDIWRKITILFLVAMFLKSSTWFSDETSEEEIFSDVFTIIINLGVLFIVHQHIKQLRMKLATYC